MTRQRPNQTAIRKAAILLDMPYDAVKAAVDAYFDGTVESRGRPKRPLDPVLAHAAKQGRSWREAAELLGVPVSTLRGHLQDATNSK